MKSVIEKFLKYVSYDTTSDEDSASYPSTEKQLVLLAELKNELAALGLDAKMDEHGYVTATLAANGTLSGKKICFISHVDTSPAVSGANVKPQIIRYEGGDVVLNEEKNVVFSAAEYPEISAYVGQQIIFTDGTTLLGADDKAGVAEIMTALEYLVSHPNVKHGEIKVAFTPDEEVGAGVKYFDVASFGADFGYTVDGGKLGEIEYENFNAAAATLTVNGTSIHPGEGKNKLKNAIEIFAEFQNSLPEKETPFYTSGYEGFYMASSVSGSVENLVAKYIIRDHDMAKFEAKKSTFVSLAEKLNEKYGAGTCVADVTDSYYNMSEIIKNNFHLIDNAKLAMEKAGVNPIVVPIRGGTDGATLSHRGLPCPNLSTGGHNFHGRFEYIPVGSMEKMVEVILNLVEIYR